METTYIQINPANVITITICAGLGYLLLLAVNMAYKKVGGNGILPGAT